MAAILIGLMICLPWVGALLIWWVGDTNPRWQHALAVVFAVAGGLASLALLPYRGSEVALTLAVGGAFGNFTFTPDGLGTFLAAVAAVIGCLAVIFSVDYMRGEAQLGRYYALVLFFIGAMCGLVLTGSLFLLFLFWEITALTSYGLISFYNDDPKAVVAGIEALIITQLGGIGLLAGALLTYVYLGSFEISALLKGAAGLPANVLGILAFGCLVAAAAKSAQFPFQTWLPDAMEAPTPVSALIHAATMVNAGVYLLARFYPAFAEVPFWREAVMAVGMISALLTALMALYATDLKRVLAYSTISQLGYMVYAVGAGGVFASQFHLFSHSIFKALLFLAAGAVIHSVGTRDMRKMGGLGKQLPLVRTVFVIGALALAGLPILNGFWSKELILEAGLSGGPAWMFGVMVFSAGLTALYTFRCVYLVFFGEPREALPGHDAGNAMRIALIPLALGSLVSWLLAGSFSSSVAETLPFHELEALPLGEILLDVIKAPATWLALVVIGLGLACWWWRGKLILLKEVLAPLGWAAERSFGFERINRWVVETTGSAAEDLRGMQTGLLGWNVLAILIGLVWCLQSSRWELDMDANIALRWLFGIIFGASPLAYFLGRIGYRFLGGQVSAARWLSLAALLLAWIPLFFAGLGVLQGGPVTAQVGAISLEMDGLGLFLAVTVLMLVTLVSIYSIHYMKGEQNEEKYYAMLLAMTGTMIGLGCARDLFNLWVWFEAMAITSYLLVAFYHQKGSLEAGVKYIIQSGVGSALVLFGIALVFVQSGSLDLIALRPALKGSGLISIAAGALFLIGFGVKAALVPMHTWLPDAHSQAPSGVSALLSGVVIECGLVAILRAVGALQEVTTAWGAVLLLFGIFNMLVGNLMALRQNEIKRMLAYSSVAQVGYMLIGFGVAAAYGLADGAAGGFFHLFNHAVMKGLAFLAAGALLFAIHISKGDHSPLVRADLNGAAKRYPLTAFAFSVAVLALGGLPPLSGFMSKWQIFVAGAEVRSTPLLWLVIFAGLNSVLSLGYYAPLVNRMYRREPSAAVVAGKPIAALMALPLVVLVLLAVLPGFWPSLLTWLTNPAAASLLTGFGY